MSDWKPFTLQMIPGMPDALEVIGEAAGTLSGLLDGLSALIDTLSGIVSGDLDPINASLVGLQELADQLHALLNSGVYFYLDKGPYFVGGEPDGLTGFITRWEDSFDDLGDSDRPPPVGEGASVSAMIFLVGGNDLPTLRPLLWALGNLFNVPALVVADIEMPKDYPEFIEDGISTPPDWKSMKLSSVLSPFEKLEQALQKAVGLLAVGASYAKMLNDLARLIASKATALSMLSDQTEELADDITLLIETEGVHFLQVEAPTIVDLVQAVKDAEDTPELDGNAFVTGVCLLGETADFGAAIELLGE